MGLLSLGMPVGLLYGEPETLAKTPSAVSPDADPWKYRGAVFATVETGFWSSFRSVRSQENVPEYGTLGGLGVGYRFSSDCLPEFQLCLDGQVLGRVVLTGWPVQWRASVEERIAFFFRGQHRVGLLVGTGVGVGSRLTDGLSSSLVPTASQVDLWLGTSLGLVVRATPTIDFTWMSEMWNPVLSTLFSPSSFQERAQYGFTGGIQFRL